MKTIHAACIWQLLSFNTEAERAAYLDRAVRTANRKGQAPVQVISQTTEDGRFFLQLCKPYNNNPMRKDV